MRNTSKLHEGHRSRLREKFLNNDFRGMQEHEILEIILFTSIPRRNTNEIAHALLDRFGSLSEVFNADLKSLQEISGIGENTAFFLHMIPQIVKIYELQKQSESCDCLDPKKICRLMFSQYAGVKSERVYLALANARGRLIDIQKISDGNLNCAPIYMRKIISLAIKNNAQYAIISHNHPSGSAVPSINDIETSYKIKLALNSINVQFLDHLIITEDTAISLRESEIVPDLFCKGN